MKVNVEILKDSIYFDIKSIDDEELKKCATLFMDAVNHFKNEEYKESAIILEKIKGSFKRRHDN